MSQIIIDPDFKNLFIPWWKPNLILTLFHGVGGRSRLLTACGGVRVQRDSPRHLLLLHLHLELQLLVMLLLLEKAQRVRRLIGELLLQSRVLQMAHIATAVATAAATAGVGELLWDHLALWSRQLHVVRWSLTGQRAGHLVLQVLAERSLLLTVVIAVRNTLALLLSWHFFVWLFRLFCFY